MYKALDFISSTSKKIFFFFKGLTIFLPDSLFKMPIPHSPDKGVNILGNQVYQCVSGSLCLCWGAACVHGASLPLSESWYPHLISEACETHCPGWLLALTKRKYAHEKLSSHM